MTDQTNSTLPPANEPMVVKDGLLSMQVCVLKTFTDEETIAYANSVNPAGTVNGWFLLEQGALFWWALILSFSVPSVLTAFIEYWLYSPWLILN